MIRFEEYFKKVITYRNIDFYDTNHSVERFKSRVSNDIDVYLNLIKKGIDTIIKSGKQSDEDRYIFYSKLLGFGIQAHYRQDRMTGKFACYSATTLSNNEMKYFTQKDKKLVLENIKHYNDLPDANVKKIFNESYHEVDFSIIDDALYNELNDVGYSLFSECGKIMTDFEIITI